MADLYLLLDDVRNAAKSLDSWRKESVNVEHGWLREKAKSVEWKLTSRTVFLIDTGDTRKFSQLINELRSNLLYREELRQKDGKTFDNKEASDNIGISEKTLRQWIDRRDHGEPL